MDSQTKTLEAIVHDGYTRAANSLSTILGHHVTVNNEKIVIQKDTRHIAMSFVNHENIRLVITRIIGELRSESYLLLTHEEESIICGMCRNAFGGTSVENSVIVKEIDNILSAAVVTELSNALKLKIYGGVPELYYAKNNISLAELMNNAQDEGDYFIITNSNFKFEGHGSISPVFIWKFEHKLLTLLAHPSLDTVL